MSVVRMKEFLKRHGPVVVLTGVVLVLTAVPVLNVYLVFGNPWQSIPPAFTDENFYRARVQTIVKGNLYGGEPYFFEHRNDPPLVVIGGTWLNAIPQLAGLSLNTSLLLNFILWSLLFAASVYWLFRELRVSPWIAVGGTVLFYIQSYSHVWRAVNLQTVFPFFFLFYAALLRLIREQSRLNMVIMAFVTGAAFYIYPYLWQIIAVTLGLLFFYALFRKDWPLLKATLISSVIGGAIGLPVPLYGLWLSSSSPYFWESAGRLGLVNTHLPMAEIVYSGGWVGVVLALLAVLCWRSRTLREDKDFILLTVFIFISGLGLWIMQGSNFITGKLLETGEHLRLFIMQWFLFTTIGAGVFLWKRRIQIAGRLRVFLVITVAVLLVANGYYFFYSYFPTQFLPSNIDRGAWQTEQLYVKPFEWLQNNEKSPIVVWSDPRDALTLEFPIYTRHFTLYAPWGMFELLPEGEIRERYLVSQYFNNPTVSDFKNNMTFYLGRQDIAHNAKTIERGIKICRILFFWDKNKDCGTPPTPQSLLGEKFFTDLESKFNTDIKPNIKAYLKKYHVSYILKDNVLDLQYHPEKLGAVRVYSDGRFEIYKMQY